MNSVTDHGLCYHAGPTREKHFWLGDASVTAEEAMYNLWSPATYELFAREIRDSQMLNTSNEWFGFVSVRCAFFTMDSAVLGLGSSGCGYCTVRVFRQKFTLEDAIGSHAVTPLEALAGV